MYLSFSFDPSSFSIEFLCVIAYSNSSFLSLVEKYSVLKFYHNLFSHLLKDILVVENFYGYYITESCEPLYGCVLPFE